MTQIGSAYAEAFYGLMKEEQQSESVLQQLRVLDTCFSQEPEFLRLLSSPNLSKQERCQVVDDSFRGKVHPYLLNFLKILTEKGYMRYFSECCTAYRDLYNTDNGILPVTAVTAVALSEAQADKLTGKLAQITGKKIELINQIDPAVLGGIRLNYDGKQLNDTVSGRLEAVGKLLKNTVL